MSSLPRHEVTGYTKKWYKQGDALLAEIAMSHAGSGEALLWFFGQAGFVIKLGNVTLAIDIILHDYYDGSVIHRRLSPPPFPPNSALPADYVLCTHNHSDHLNLETLLPQARGNPETRFIVPAPCVPVLLDGGISQERVIAAREGCPIQAGAVTITPVAAAHSEYKTDEQGDNWYLSYLMTSGGVTVYHAGDGIVTGQLVTALKNYRPIHIAILPVNGMDWERTARGIIGNMNSEDAVKLAYAIDADITIPAHFDFLCGNTINPAHFTSVFYSLYPEKKQHLPALGERFIYRL